MAFGGAEEYWPVRFLFQRSIALIYLRVFLVAARQFRPLAGEDGLLPIDRFLGPAARISPNSNLDWRSSRSVDAVTQTSGFTGSPLSARGRPGERIGRPDVR